MNILEIPYYSVNYLHQKLYGLGILKENKMPVRILSVGNLTFGGTGKSPMISFLVEEYSKNKKIAVLSRGYKRKTKGFYKVNIKNPGCAEKYGDEPCMLAIKHPQTSVYVCEDRVVGVQEILKQENPDWIFLDDAFQNYKIKKDINILLIDATEGLESYRFLPLGRLRSPVDDISKADYVFLTKVNLVNKEKIDAIKSFFKNVSFLEFNAEIETVYSPITKSVLDPQEVYLLSGIAKPNNFKKNITDLNFKVLMHFVFSDHYKFKKIEIENILKVAGDKPILTTEKDWTKLKEFNIPNLYVTNFKLKPQSSLQGLSNALS